MALKITRSVLDEAIVLRNSGDIAGAWAVLSEAGDLYAANARDIIAEINSPSSVFAKIVQVHWDRVSPGARQSVFMDVGWQHLTQYLDYIDEAASGTNAGGEQLYLLPKTEQIEYSYRLAVTQHDLPALTAVDSLFSVMDWNFERSNEPLYVLARAANAKDLTWAQMLDPELEMGRIVYDSKVFLNDNIEPFKETLNTMGALIAKAIDTNDAELIITAVQLFNMTIGTIGDVLPQMLGLEEPEAIALTANLLLSLDAGMSEEKLMRFLDSITIGDTSSALGDLRNLEWITRNVYQALTGSDPGSMDDKDVLYATAIGLISNLKESTTQNYGMIDLIDTSVKALVNIASQDDALGRAYRYALVNLQPFALVQLDNGNPHRMH